MSVLVNLGITVTLVNWAQILPTHGCSTQKVIQSVNFIFYIKSNFTQIKKAFESLFIPADQVRENGS